MPVHRLLWLVPLLFAQAPVIAAEAPARPLEFNRDIRPILSENCFFCHGQDPQHRKADLRLDVRASALADLGGYAAIVPGKPDASDIIRRMESHDPDDLMPPAKSNRRVSAGQIAILRRWIAEGAPYQKHWAFEPPARPVLPAVKQGDWPLQPLDRFVLALLEAEGLRPSLPARPEVWLRRASFDLVGLPPTIAELDQFLADVATRGEPAYAAAVDRLLASPAFGERQAIEWLDISRYADTHGFNNDSARSMWRWRDWVIDSFNANKPYDQFVTEQLAGDLLPGATFEQRLATGFGRNHVINSEGGIIDEEYRVEYVADRVRTTSLAWLGLTFECARCHDHKFDPITQKAFYEFYAFFNNVAEFGEDGRVANAVPLMAAPTKEQQAKLHQQTTALAKLRETEQAARAKATGRAGKIDPQAIAGLAASMEPGPAMEPSFVLRADTAEAKEKAWSFPAGKPALVEGVAGKAWQATGEQPVASLDGKALDLNNPKGATLSLWVKPSPDAPVDAPILSNQDRSGSPADAQYGKGAEVRIAGGEIEFRASARWPVYAMQVRSEGAAIKADQWRHLVVQIMPSDPSTMVYMPASRVRMFIDGRELPTRVLHDGMNGGIIARPWLVAADKGHDATAWRGSIDDLRLYSSAVSSDKVRALFAAAAWPYLLKQHARGEASPVEQNWIEEAWLLSTDPAFLAARNAVNRAWEEHLATLRAAPTVMVMADLPTARPAFVLKRGMYDSPGEPVSPNVPEDLLGPWPDGAPRNRLGLAKWLTRPDHPLTARVVVNRWWAQLFGTGIVKTVEDFGFQSEWPSHPELLDFLARNLVDGGWNTKQFLRSLVLSATYRQSSDVTPALLERDPDNRLLARGPRFRLPAELIRDQALAVSGLLKPRIGGPSVYPYQPDGLYDSIVVGAAYPGTVWKQSSGDDLYRRSLYTFWKRTVPHPTMTTFDAPDREFCSARRSRTNTPLQALILLNEPGYLESARRLGERMIREGGDHAASRAAFGFRLATGRHPSAAEASVLTRKWEQFRREYAADEAGAAALLKSAAPATAPSASGKNAAEHAAATLVASMILNLDETVTR